MIGSVSKIVASAVVTASVFVSTPAGAQDWTRFRGPNGTGISSATTVPVQFAEKDYNWRVALPGAGHSSPVVWGKKVFLTGANEDTGKRHLFCVSTTEGKLLWKSEYGFSKYSVHPQFNRFASGSPAVDADHVYLTWATPDSLFVTALDHNGREVWKRESLGNFTGSHGCGQSPIVVGDILVVPNDNEKQGPSWLMGLNRRTGATKWVRPRPTTDSAAYATPMVYQPKGGKPELVFTCKTHGFTSLDPETGDVNWEVTGVFNQRCVSSPVQAGDLLIGTCGAGDGSKQLVAIRPGSKGKPGEVAYRMARNACYVPTPIAFGERLFLWGDQGIVTCLNAKTGDVVWTERADGNYFASPVCINGKIYNVNTKGEVVVIDASDQFKLLARNPVLEESYSTPAVSDGVLYVRTETHLISVGGKKK